MCLYIYKIEVLNLADLKTKHRWFKYVPKNRSTYSRTQKKLTFNLILDVKSVGLNLAEFEYFKYQ